MEEKIEITPVNPTISVFLESDLLLEPISRLLYCVPIENFIHNEKGCIPYFGKEDIIVGNKSHLWESHGVRCQGLDGKPGAMKNCVSIDYQIYEKNFNIKIYKNKFHIVGTNSFESLTVIINNIVDKLNNLSKSWKKFFKMSISERKKFVKTIIYPLISKNDKLRTIDEEFWKDYKEARLKNNQMKHIIKNFLSFIFQFKCLKEYKKKLAIICHMETGTLSVFSNARKIIIKEIKILECTYMGSLPFKNILLGDVALAARQKGIDATFHNQRGKFIRIVTDKGLENEIVKKTSSKLPLHQINIFDSGHIRINSPAKTEIVLLVVRKYLKMIKKIIEEIGLDVDSEENINSRILQNIKRFEETKEKN